MTLNKANDELAKPDETSEGLKHMWAEISSLHEFLWQDAMNYKHGHSRYDKITVVDSVDRQVKAKVESYLNHRLTQFAEELEKHKIPVDIADHVNEEMVKADGVLISTVQATLKEYVRKP